MNQTLKKLIEDASGWPESGQAELAAYAREIRARRTGTYMLSDEERAAIRTGLSEADRNEFVPEAEIDAFWKRSAG